MFQEFKSGGFKKLLKVRGPIIYVIQLGGFMLVMAMVLRSAQGQDRVVLAGIFGLLFVIVVLFGIKASNQLMIKISDNEIVIDRGGFSKTIEFSDIENVSTTIYHGRSALRIKRKSSSIPVDVILPFLEDPDGCRECFKSKLQPIQWSAN